MENYITTLAKQILQITPEGLSKVRFAKFLYLVHKALAQGKISNPDALAFIRMPLGPVPVGFKELSKDSGIVVTREQNTGLSYNTQRYSLKKGVAKVPGDKNRTNAIQKVMTQLHPLTTSQLVGYTHEEPSWKSHKNGDEYFIENADLDRSLPLGKKKSLAISSEIDDQHLQAQLVSGMLDEIVDESTALEYSQPR